MLSSKSRIIIAIISVFMFFLLGTISWYYLTKERPESPAVTSERMQAEVAVIETIDLSEGGYVVEDGFNISYMETEQIFSVTITKNPFEKYKAKALSWMSDHGMDPQSTSYLCFVTADIEVTEEQINRCGTTNIQ